jgi:hypothetical protein
MRKELRARGREKKQGRKKQENKKNAYQQLARHHGSSTCLLASARRMLRPEMIAIDRVQSAVRLEKIVRELQPAAGGEVGERVLLPRLIRNLPGGRFVACSCHKKESNPRKTPRRLDL